MSGIPVLTSEEFRQLVALSVGAPVQLASAHRVRLEMRGLILDGPAGMKLTALGRAAISAAAQEAAQEAAGEKKVRRPSPPPPAGKRDKAGKRLPFTRKLPIP